MHYELSQSFYFEAAHTLERAYETVSSRLVHGHTYHAEIALSGLPDPSTGMVTDLAVVRSAIAQVRERLDHRFLDDVPGLAPATLERLCEFVWQALQPALPTLAAVTVERRASGDRCVLRRRG
jgi:6-pyruvoyltetrahydropterin/6-carboxytetrahydropterin synthase